MIQTDFLVIGSGIAGLWFSYRVARAGRVLIVTKKSDTDSNTNYAQGGIAAAVGADDSPDLHFQDTVRAGEGLCHEEVVRTVAEEGPGLVERLYGLGVGFDTYQDTHGLRHFQLAREGGHLRHRIVHARDYTGQEVEHGLVRVVKGEAKVIMLEDHFASDLTLDDAGRCSGCRVVDEATGAVNDVRASWTLLATGGIGQVYLATTNPPIATGDGIAMAFRAGARIANMEFIQFHPTSLHGFTIAGRAFLISEAVRGEGGLLKTQDGDTFMERYHELGNLAPRDIVARAIDAELKKRGEEYALLDITHLDPDRVRARFPNIHQQCLKFGIDITRQPIPVVPAAHYVCGGIEVNLNAQTSIPGLFAAGECACSGLHGANRLASNSLLEALVLAEHAARAATDAERTQEGCRKDAGNAGDAGRTQEGCRKCRIGNSCKPCDPAAPASEAILQALRSLMSRCVAIVRTDMGLADAWNRLEELKEEFGSLGVRELTRQSLNSPTPQLSDSSTPQLSIRTLELGNMLIVAQLIVRSAMLRKESRGLHYNRDYPGRDDVHFRKDTVLTKQDLPATNAGEGTANERE